MYKQVEADTCIIAILKIPHFFTQLQAHVERHRTVHVQFMWDELHKHVQHCLLIMQKLKKGLSSTSWRLTEEWKYSFMNFVIRWRSVVSFTPWPIWHLDGGLVGPRACLSAV